jgi:hypothetical protein
MANERINYLHKPLFCTSGTCKLEGFLMKKYCNKELLKPKSVSTSALHHKYGSSGERKKGNAVGVILNRCHGSKFLISFYDPNLCKN